MWIDTVDGLNRYDGYEYRIYRNNPLDSNSIPGNRINALCEDSDHNVWIGTKENGLNYYSNGKYKVYDCFESNSQSRNFNITDIGIDRGGNVWIAVYNSGLYAFINNKFERFQEDEISPNALNSNRIRALDWGGDGILWIATENGLESFDPMSRIFSHHEVPGESRSRIFRKNI